MNPPRIQDEPQRLWRVSMASWRASSVP
jgi:hypothetical protein